MTIEELRTERNRRLAETDFYALKDVRLPPAMKEYREQLRDLPAKKDLDLDNVVWPTKPEI